MGQSGSFWSGFFLGGLAGAVWGLLNAPQSGGKTRLQIEQRSTGLRTQFEELTADFQTRGIDAVREKLPISGETRGPVTVNVEKSAQQPPEEQKQGIPAGEMRGPATITVEEEAEESPKEEHESAPTSEERKAATVKVEETDRKFPEEEQKTLPGEEQEPERLLPKEED
jgi:gas vesicle protein